MFASPPLRGLGIDKPNSAVSPDRATPDLGCASICARFAAGARSRARALPAIKVGVIPRPTPGYGSVTKSSRNSRAVGVSSRKAPPME
jgi:hypothetical protein